MTLFSLGIKDLLCKCHSLHLIPDRDFVTLLDIGLKKKKSAKNPSETHAG